MLCIALHITFVNFPNNFFMKKKMYLWVSLLVAVAMAVILLSLYFIGTNKKLEDTPLETPYTFEMRPEYEEQYLSFVYDAKGNPIELETFSKKESDTFIERLREQDIDPKHMLKAGNDIFFTAGIKNSQEVTSVGIFVYDNIAWKIVPLFTSSEPDTTLVAIDVINNELIVRQSYRDETCESLWLHVPDNLYSLSLSDAGDPQLQPYQIPEWKIEEELFAYPECRPVDN